MINLLENVIEIANLEGCTVEYGRLIEPTTVRVLPERYNKSCCYCYYDDYDYDYDYKMVSFSFLS